VPFPFYDRGDVRAVESLSEAYSVLSGFRKCACVRGKPQLSRVRFHCFMCINWSIYPAPYRGFQLKRGLLSRASARVTESNKSTRHYPNSVESDRSGC
jgi:hypothetical protein